MSTIKVNKIIPVGGVPSGGGGGIIQVVSATKTDTFTSSSTSFVAITGLSVNITPTSSSSKILVYFSVDGSNTDAGATSAKLAVFKDGSNYLGANIGNKSRAWQIANYGDNNTGELIGFQFLDSPSTTSQITYDLRVAAQQATATINRSGSDNDSALFGYRSASTITAMEVSA
tara:strand:- start:581 stop:1099 length:519 start_codon:yes stop_codon:yes gene_type:complete